MKRIVWLVIFLSIGVGFWVWKNRGEGKIQYLFVTKQEMQRRKDAEFVKKVQEKIADQKYAVEVMRLSTGETYGFNEGEIMPARSVIKVPIIITAIRLGLDNTYDDLLFRIGKNSDNAAQVKVEKIVGVEEIKKTLGQLGMKNTDFDNNTTTANDLIKMWVYVSKDVNLEKYLTDSIWEDRIAMGIPEDIKLVHKVGTDISVWNDSGIVYTAKPFILVILNDEVEREAATKLVPKITKMVWDYETIL